MKSGAAETQAAAREQVGWELRYSQKMRWLYRASGIKKLLDKPRRYALAKLSSQQICELQNYLRDFGAETQDEVGSHIKQAFGVSYTRGGLSIFCRRLRIRLKTARPSNEKRTKRRLRHIKNFGELSKDYEGDQIEFEDEMHIGTRAALGRRWTPEGTRPVGKRQIGYERELFVYFD